jgi:hypothetical protein
VGEHADFISYANSLFRDRVDTISEQQRDFVQLELGSNCYLDSNELYHHFLVSFFKEIPKYPVRLIMLILAIPKILKSKFLLRKNKT